MRIGLAFKTPELTAVHSAYTKTATTADNDQNGPRHDVLAKRHALAKECAKDHIADNRTDSYRGNNTSGFGNARIAPQAAIHVEKPKYDDVDNREHSNCRECARSPAK